MKAEVTIDGRQVTADLVETPGGWSLLLGTRSYEVAVGPGLVYIDGRAFPITADEGARCFAADRKGPRRGHAGGPQQIVAPMPGRVVKILVKPGDAVEARQGVIVVEAMKMENELRATGPGTVSEVRVAEGASVEANSVLVVIA